jgi:flavin reductase (DIM6/NTAB) family NADH-FMN oxidoreductase RutF
VTLDPATFRAVLGRLASGVSVITLAGNDGRDHGITVTALCSLSIDPPLLLACVDRTATVYPHLSAASHFAVNLLSSDQETLSRRFAETREDRFDGVAFERGASGIALLDHALAHIECSMWAHHDGGDHTVFVGRVTHAAARDGQPLVYYLGRYRELRP